MREVSAAQLPVHLTSFIGRDREHTEVRRLLAGTRLLTLTGAGGSGKTRLALEVAAAAAPSYGDGAACVELAPLQMASGWPSSSRRSSASRIKRAVVPARH